MIAAFMNEDSLPSSAAQVLLSELKEDWRSAIRSVIIDRQLETQMGYEAGFLNCQRNQFIVILD